MSSKESLLIIMKSNLIETLKSRRTYYSIDDKISVSKEEIKNLLENVVLHTPSSFNSQSTRIVLLTEDNHKKLWDLTKDILKKIVPAEAFENTEKKIDHSFRAGYGTILFYEDQEVVEGLQKAFAAYSENFPIWSNQSNAMNQYATWLLLEEAGLGASLQHYNPLIDDAVAKEWNINPTWKLIGQMPFGNPTVAPGEKEFKPLDERLKIF